MASCAVAPPSPKLRLLYYGKALFSIRIADPDINAGQTARRTAGSKGTGGATAALPADKSR
jgi:hypothetical protein